MANKLKDTTPRPRIGKTAKDTRMARLIDINKIVTEFNQELAQEVLDLQTQIDVLSLGGGSEYTETIVNISSAQILDVGNNNIVLLPNLSAGSYYSDWYMSLELTTGTPYDMQGDLGLFLYYGNTDNGILIASSFIESASNNVINISSREMVTLSTDPNAYGYAIKNGLSDINLGLKIGTNNSDPITGTGTLRAKIYHKTITFGA